MATKPQRITNGQRAAVCALILAGLTRTEACRIVGAPHKLMYDLLPPSWRKRKPSRPSKWVGPALERLRLAYLDRTRTVATVARQFGLSVDVLRKIACRNDWARRKRGPVPVMEALLLRRHRAQTEARP